MFDADKPHIGCSSCQGNHFGPWSCGCGMACWCMAKDAAILDMLLPPRPRKWISYADYQRQIMESKMNTTELKGLQTNLEQFNVDLELLLQEKRATEERISGVRAKIVELEEEVKRLKDIPEVTVSQ
jgi:peptidoglycan hydrolase CwlO-like protein